MRDFKLLQFGGIRTASSSTPNTNSQTTCRDTILEIFKGNFVHMQNKICFRLLLYVYSLTMLIHVSIALLFFCFSALLNLVISPLCRDLYQLTVSCGLPIHTRYVHSRTLFWCPCSFHSCQRCGRCGRCRYFRKIRAVSLAPYPQLCDLPCLTISTPAICAQDSHPTPTPSPPPPPPPTSPAPVAADVI